MAFVQYSMQERFGAEFPNVQLIGQQFEAGDPALNFVPKIDQNYTFDRDALADVLNYLQECWNGGTSEAQMLIGPTGSGKTSLIHQVCARLGAPVMDVTGHGRLEIPQLLYSKIAVDGTTMTLDGPLTAALAKGMVFLLNEIDLIEPETLTGLNDVLEYQRVVIEDDGRLVRAERGFAFIATCNTAGGGDDTGMYAGTKVQNIAFRDRFRKSLVDYRDEASELAVLQRLFPSIDQKLAEKFVKVANLVRNAFKDGSTGMDVTLSLRTLIRWVKLTSANSGQQAKGRSPVHYALDRALAFGTSPGTYEALHQMVSQEFGVGPTIANPSIG
ncbi:MAG: hypothetical protein BGP25_05040 [Lysobacterales bacterium 63-13]|nr:MAG: hypothetical protein BGP25_05040 [Xanthomonadales bacterium 63-13]